MEKIVPRWQTLIVLLAVLALRAPFLNQAIQGDDLFYLYGAEHAQIDPLHPNHAQYVFQGRMVTMQGHPHPPLNSWFLAALLAMFGSVEEIPFHAAYLLFSIIAALSALSLARRFSPHPLLATLLFLAAPVFLVNGNSLEADLPFLALWLLSVALFVSAVDRRSLWTLASACLAMALTALAAYQSIVLVPILLLYGRKWKPAWLAAMTVPLVLGMWQIFERSSTGALPASVLAGYMHSYGLQQLAQKLKNAIALTGHLAWLVCPILWIPGLAAAPFALGAIFYDWNPLFWGSIAVGCGILIYCLRLWRDFLAQWILIFYAAALILFFAGSARYLLPITLPVAILATRRSTPRILILGIGGSAVLGLGLAAVNYQHWDAYRQFARSLPINNRVWVNADWGFRFYLEQRGALPLLEGQTLHPGETVVSSALSGPIKFTGPRALIAEKTITSPIPLRLVSIAANSGYSSTSFGLRPFAISTADIDRVRSERILENKPSLSVLPMNAPQADQQIVNGVYSLEDGKYRWMGAKADILLKTPAPSAIASVNFYIPDAAPARSLVLSIDGQEWGRKTYSGPGSYTLTTRPQRVTADSATLTIAVDQSFSVPGDQRQLGVILLQVALLPAP